MMSIEEVFETKESKVFVAYVTAGDPNLEVSKELCQRLTRAGVDIIELGVPFSDPLADGPTNQLAAERALASGTSLSKILQTVKEIRQSGLKTPIVLFSYLNPIFAMGYESFAKGCKESGVNGALVLDLPCEEAGDYLEAMRSQSIDTVFLASPTTTKDRLQLLGEQSRGFVYYVSRTGVTGVQAEVSASLEAEVAEVKKHIKTPLVIGFGISTPEQAQQVAAMGDGIVIGSAIVKQLEGYDGDSSCLDKLETYAASISEALK